MSIKVLATNKRLQTIARGIRKRLQAAGIDISTVSHSPKSRSIYYEVSVSTKSPLRLSRWCPGPSQLRISDHQLPHGFNLPGYQIIILRHPEDDYGLDVWDTQVETDTQKAVDETVQEIIEEYGKEENNARTIS